MWVVAYLKMSKIKVFTVALGEAGDAPYGMPSRTHENEAVEPPRNGERK